MKLYPHQDDALNCTESFNKVAYYLDMGLGKTYVGTEKMVRLKTDVNVLICQKSKVNDWINHFIMYEDEFKMIYDCTLWKKDDWTALLENPNEPCVMVINYELAFRRSELLELKHFTLMLDESSMIQNDTNKRTKFVLKLNSSRGPIFGFFSYSTTAFK